MPSILFVDPLPTTSSRPPPKYEHPPPYAVDYTPGRGDASEVRIHRVPESSAAAIRREFLRARSPASSSSTPYIVLACIVFWLCGCVFGTVAFILAGQLQQHHHKGRIALDGVAWSVCLCVGHFLEPCENR